MQIDLHNGDCLELMKDIPGGSVDLVLTDPPYGTMKGQGNSPAAKSLGLDNCEWDESIDPLKLFEVANRILRKNGKLILFSQEPYTSKLITEAIHNLPFSYRAIWEKPTTGNPLKAKKAMLVFYEDILVFSKYEEDKTGHALQDYFYNEFKKSGFTVKEICEKLGTTHASHFFTKGMQFRVPNEKYLKQLQNITGRFQIEYAEIAKTQSKFLERHRIDFPSTFNLWEGNKYKSNILKYKKDYTGLHPTQKPILLLEDLIKTFSNEGDLAVDLTMGSGSTGVACINMGRNFIGIELDKGYFNIAQERIEAAQAANWR